MKTKRTLLVLSALPHDIKRFKDLYFLGHWCFVCDKYNKLKKKNFKIQKHHWTSLPKLKKDAIKLEKYYEEILSKLASKLNEYHKTSYNKNYWRVIIGPWLYFYLISMFDRWETIDRLKKIRKFIIPSFNFKKNIFENYDTINYWNNASQSDSWNNANFLRIIKYKYKDLKFVKNIIKDKKFRTKIIKPKIKNYLSSIVKILVFQLDRIFSKISFLLNQVYIEIFYFSKIDAINFYLKCNQFPSFNYKTFEYSLKPKIKIDLSKRKEIFEPDKVHDDKKNFNNFLNNCLVSDFPIAFLESYRYLDNLNSSNNKFKINFVFSSISQIFNERYKIWLAKMINMGSKHFIVGHGGGLPVIYNNNLFRHELKISKKYISWHKPFHTKHHRMTSPLIKKWNTAYKNFHYDPKNCLILSCDTLRYPVKIQGYPYVEQYKIWLRDIEILITKLDKKIRNQIVYRCSATDVGFQTDKILKKKFNYLNLSDFNSKSLKDELQRTKISIITYPETVIPECLLSEKPMIITLSPKIYHFMPHVKKMINEMKKNKIFFDNSYEASKFINKIWKDPELWWKNKKTVRAINRLKEFTFENKENWISDWKNFIQNYK